MRTCTCVCMQCLHSLLSVLLTHCLHALQTAARVHTNEHTCRPPLSTHSLNHSPMHPPTQMFQAKCPNVQTPKKCKTTAFKGDGICDNDVRMLKGQCAHVFECYMLVCSNCGWNEAIHVATGGQMLLPLSLHIRPH